MNKTELVERIADDADLDKQSAARAVDAAVEAIMTSLQSGDEVNIPGFGKWSVSERGERQGRNPATGETITIKASKNPKFSAGKAFKDRLN